MFLFFSSFACMCVCGSVHSFHTNMCKRGNNSNCCIFMSFSLFLSSVFDVNICFFVYFSLFVHYFLLLFDELSSYFWIIVIFIWFFYFYSTMIHRFLPNFLDKSHKITPRNKNCVLLEMVNIDFYIFQNHTFWNFVTIYLVFRLFLLAQLGCIDVAFIVFFVFLSV